MTILCKGGGVIVTPTEKAWVKNPREEKKDNQGLSAIDTAGAHKRKLGKIWGKNQKMKNQ